MNRTTRAAAGAARAKRISSRLRAQFEQEGIAATLSAVRDYVMWRWRGGGITRAGTTLADWHAAYAAVPPDSPRPETGFTIVCPAFNSTPRFLRACVDSVIGQSHANWELILVDDASTAPESRACLAEVAGLDERIRLIRLPENEGIAGATNAGIAQAALEYLVFLDHDDLLAEHALSWLSSCTPEADLIYTDEDKIDEYGNPFLPTFKPAWSPRLLLGRNYVNHITCIRTVTVRDLGGLRRGFDGAQDHDLLLRLSEQHPVVAHIPHILYHWREWGGAASAAPGTHIEERGVAAVADAIDRRGWSAHAALGAGEPFNYRLVWDPEPDARPNVKVVIPTRDRLELLERAVAGVLERTDGIDSHVVIVDNGSREAETLDYLRALQADRDDVSILRIDDAFNYSRLCNEGAWYGPDAEYLLLLNNDVEVMHRNWLLELSGWLRDPEVMGVGPKLLLSDGRIQHAGVVLGHSGIAAHYAAHRPNEPQYGNLHDQAREVWGLSTACLLFRAADYQKMGGMLEELPLDYQDVELCLRMHRDIGGTFVYDPTYPLIHLESASRGSLGAASAYTVSRMQFWWHDEIAAGDPFYSPHFTLTEHDFSLRDLPEEPDQRLERLVPRWHNGAGRPSAR
jgi:GT2 family glycosyltransferase